ncbi:MAG: dihydroorotase [Rikenellaceae bacterium]
MSKTLIENGTIINQGESFEGYLIIDGEFISEIARGEYLANFEGERINAKGKIVMPGVIDDQVHFRDPGLTYKGDMFTESLAGVAGGVTSFMDMPNTTPQTTTRELLEQKYEYAASHALANHGFYLGATNDNLKEIVNVDPTLCCGVKIFMGSSTGNMLVDSDKALSAIFAESPILIATHCEQEEIVKANLEKAKQFYGDKISAVAHPEIRNAEACYRCSARAVKLADKYGSNLHVLHLSSALELSLFEAKAMSEKKITNEVCVHHLWFSDEDYALKGNMIKWNPAIKSMQDRDALREGLLSGKVDVIATDHAPHTLEEKSRGYLDAPSGGPMLQHSLVAMMELANQGVLSKEKVVEKMCHAPASRYKVVKRGFLKEGFYADVVVLDANSPWQVEKNNILYKCAWSPMEGVTFSNKVIYTFINGHKVNNNGEIDKNFRAKALKFQ